MKQNSIKSSAGSKKKRMRVGRGGAKGTYSGRGMKGQKARTGGGVRPGFEGGQTPLLRRMPKLKGFRNPNKLEYFPLNIGRRLDELFEDGAKIDANSLLEKGVIGRPCKIKLLGTGEIKKKFHFTVDLASASAIKKLEKAGGTLTLLKKLEKPVKES